MHKTILTLFLLASFQTGFSQDAPSPYTILIHRADSLRSVKNWKMAERAYQQALVFDANSVKAINGLGELAQRRHDWQKTQVWFRKTLTLDPENRIAKTYFENNPDIISNLKRGDKSFKSGDLKSAERAYEKVLHYNSQSLPALRRLTEIAYQDEKWQKFKGRVQQVLEINAGDDLALRLLRNPKLERRLNQADSLVEARDLKEAKKLYEQALMMDHQSLRALNGLGKLYHRMLDWGKSKRWFKRALNIDPMNEETNYYINNGPNPNTIPILNEARSYHKQGQLDNAEKEYRRAIKIYPGTVQAFRGLGQIAFEHRDWDEVKNWYNKLLEVQPLEHEAMYALGVAYREDGKTNSLIFKKKLFANSRKRFDQLIAADSTYEDVLFQRGLLERWQGNWDGALAYGHRQLVLKPALATAHTGLWKLHRLMMMNSTEIEFTTWRQTHSGPWADYLLAEQLRRTGKIARADSLYDSIINYYPGFNSTLIYLARIRLNIQKGDEEEANRYFRLALKQSRSKTDVAFLFEDWKYLFKDTEYDFYQKLRRAQDQKAFFLGFWTARNPTPAASKNARAIEHYRRLVHAEQGYWFDGARSDANRANKAIELKFPTTYWLNDEFNDKGLIYIRHGEPDEIARTADTDVSNESWLYYRRQDRDKLIFHFVVDENLGVKNDWQLVPILPDKLSLLQDRTGWDPKMDRIALTRNRQESLNLQYQVIEESRQVILASMQSDFHTWDEQYSDLSLPYFISSFRGVGRRTAVEVYLGIPISELEDPTAVKTGKFEIEHGAGMYDVYWRPVASANETANVEPDDSSHVNRGFYLHRYEFKAEPGNYHFSLHARDDRLHKVAAWNFDLEVPDYAPGPLSVSDLILANEVRPGKAGPFAKKNLALVPNPSKTFGLSDPVFLYYEIYNLSRNDEGETSFDIEINIRQLRKKRSGLAKLLPGGSKRKKSVALKENRMGTSETSIEYAGVNVSNLEEGEYELTVTISDRISKRSSRSAIGVVLDGQ